VPRRRTIAISLNSRERSEVAAIVWRDITPSGLTYDGSPVRPGTESNAQEETLRSNLLTVSLITFEEGVLN